MSGIIRIYSVNPVLNQPTSISNGCWVFTLLLACSIGITVSHVPCIWNKAGSICEISVSISLFLLIAAVLMEHHWFPLVAVKHREELTIWLEKHPVATAISFHPAWEVFVIEPDSGARCGVHTLMSLATALGMKVIDLAQNDSFEVLRSLFHQHTKPRCDPIRWELGRSGQLVKNLTEELLKHGIPLIAQ